MDSRRFGDLARTMVSTSSRRVALPAVVGALVGLPGIAAAQRSDRPGAANRAGRVADVEVVRKDARRFEQADPDGAGGPRASGKDKKKAKKQPIGIRSIWWWEDGQTGATGGVRCVVTCPKNMQATGGGAFDMSLNGVSPLDYPTSNVRVWEVLVLTSDGAQAWANPYAVCVRR